MKFMKLGSKPDSFQTDGDDIRYVATELPPDIVVNVGSVKFYLHKFPLLSKSARLQKLFASTREENSDEIHVRDIPGGPAAFEICAKYCYGMTVTLNSYNVVTARCAAEYLEMYETVEKGNLVYKVDVFLNSSIFRSWKDSIIVLQTTKSLLPWSEELRVVSHCIDSIASKASIDTSKVDWSYTYNRKKLLSENGKDPYWNGEIKQQMVPKDWWVEDLCELQLDLYKRVITTIKAKGKISGDVIGEALHAYALRRLPGFSKGQIQCGDIIKSKSIVATFVQLLPPEQRSASCSFLLKLLGAAVMSECGDEEKHELMRRIGQQLEDATVADLLIQAPEDHTIKYDVDIVQSMVEAFVVNERMVRADPSVENDFQEVRSRGFLLDASKIQVAKLVDGYLAEASRDPNLPVAKFVSLAEIVSGFSRPSHDGLYRAIDMYLKEHPGMSKSERKRICRLMDCRKLSADACMHAVQNERLPLRFVVQVLFFEQVRDATSAVNSTPEEPRSIKALMPGGSHGSSRSTTTNTEEDWDTVATTEDIKAIKLEIATLKLAGSGGKTNGNNGDKGYEEKVGSNKMKGLVMSKNIFSKLWSGKERSLDISSTETSESPGSTNADETKSTPSRSRRHSVS